MTREEAIKKLESLKISLPAAKDEISEIIKLIDSPWISVNDDLPCNHEELLDPSCEYNETVIVLTVCGNGYYLNWMKLERYGKWEWHSVKNVTHWMKLPELPKEEEIKL